MQQSSNPVFNDKVIRRSSDGITDKQSMTVSGSIVKTGFLLAILLVTAAWSWSYTEANSSSAGWITFGASIAAFVVAMIMIFRPSPVLAIAYAGLQGVVMGAISFLFNDSAQGIVLQAVSLTISVFFAMLLLYSTGIVKVTERVRSMIIIATVGVFFFYLITFIIGLFSSSFYDTVFSGNIGVFIGGIIVLIAALNLLLDFDFIDRGSRQELPKQFEWYAAFGLMVTLIWLYLSILRLLAASRS